MSRAKDLIFTARLLTASQATEIGRFPQSHEPWYPAHRRRFAGLVNYLADEGQTATERAIILAQEILPAGESSIRSRVAFISRDVCAGPLAIRCAKLAIDRGSQLDL